MKFNILVFIIIALTYLAIHYTIGTPSLTTNKQQNVLTTIKNDTKRIKVSPGSLLYIDLKTYFDASNTKNILTLAANNSIIPNWLHLDDSQSILFGVPPKGSISPVQLFVSNTSNSYTIKIELILTPPQLRLSKEQRQEDINFINYLLLKESKFIALGVGVHPETATTFDGHSINRETLLLEGSPRNWSAASKESLHIMLLAKVFMGDAQAKIIIGGDEPKNAYRIAINLLNKKLTAYEQFNQSYPSFGGYLPWFTIKSDNNKSWIAPMPHWSDRTPALDNGQLAWSLYVAYKALKHQGEMALANRCQSYFKLMARNAKRMFFNEENNTVVSISQFTDKNGSGTNQLQPAQAQYVKDGYTLMDSYEGELMLMFMNLFSPDLTLAEKNALWANKFIDTKTYTTANNERITVIEGWAFSSHEQWKFMYLPYVDLPKARTLFLNGERARTDYSKRNAFPGFFASVHNDKMKYISKLGIAELASVNEKVYNDIIAPYATYPVIMADHLLGSNAGIQWLRGIANIDKMIGPYGMTEAFAVDDQAIAPVLTWDGKITTVLALMGGVVNETRDFLIEDNLYLKFLNYVNSDYSKITTDILSTPDGLALPNKPIQKIK